MHFKPTDQARQRTFASDKTKTVAARMAKTRVIRPIERDWRHCQIEPVGMSNIKRTMAGRNKQRSAGQTHRGDSFRLAASGDTTDGTKRNVSLFAHDATGLE